MLLLLLEYEGGMLPDGLKGLPADMERLFELLDVAGGMQAQHPSLNHPDKLIIFQRCLPS
jgi:hypothetical protein